MWNLWVCKKKVKRITINFFNLGKDYLIKNLLVSYNIKYALVIYDVISYNPLVSAVNILAVKLGLNKTAVLLILAFLI